MKTVALIPARGSSKRIKDKNLAKLAGKPLIAYAIEAAKNCELIDDIWVSTDHLPIAMVSEQYDAQVLARPKKLASDTATSESVLMHFAQNVEFDILVFMQATSPLTLPEHLTQGIEMVRDRQCDSALSVTEDLRFYWDTCKKPINYDPLQRPRTQDKERWYKETGAFYITNREALLQSKCRISGVIDFVIVPERYGHEIDTYDDLSLLLHLLECSS